MTTQQIGSTFDRLSNETASDALPEGVKSSGAVRVFATKRRFTPKKAEIDFGRDLSIVQADVFRRLWCR
jgi:hypothetical protein